MIPITHKELITKLLKPGDTLVQEMTAAKANINHAVVGLIGEVAGEIEKTLLPIRQRQAFDAGAPAWWNATPDGVSGLAVDRENLIEELGDLLFYEGAFQVFAGVENYAVMCVSPMLWHHSESPRILMAPNSGVYRKKLLCDLSGSLCVACGDLVDAAKKHIMYAQELHQGRVCQALSDINWAVDYMCKVLDTTVADVRQHNIDKLNRRYPAGYSDEAAKLRLDKEVGNA
jgi:NTP pyrophosphatase (non-canonical NTP hydrolase)